VKLHTFLTLELGGAEGSASTLYTLLLGVSVKYFGNPCTTTDCQNADIWQGISQCCCAVCLDRTVILILLVRIIS
jgi:hypothetical protein